MNSVGVGTRVLNFLVDTILILALSIAAFKVWEFYAFFWHIRYVPFYYFFFAFIFIYYFFFESIWARTPGKWLSMTKVVKRNGGKPSLLQIFIRSLLRATVVDWISFPFFEETLHDIFSKTAVVEA